MDLELARQTARPNCQLEEMVRVVEEQEEMQSVNQLKRRLLSD